MRGGDYNVKKLIILEFTHFSRHIVFTADGEDFRNKKLIDGITLMSKLSCHINAIDLGV